jgi:hypothetical protein
MALAQSKPKPTVFLSFAGEDVEWKRSLMKPTWWGALSQVANLYDYDDKPATRGDLYKEMSGLVGACSAFVVILSKYYIEKGGVIEHEFTTGVERFSEASLQDLFCAIIIDAEAKEWWEGRQNSVFTKHRWLQNKIYWPLIEKNEPAILSGDLEPHYARKVRDYAAKLAAAIKAIPPPQSSATGAGDAAIILLGRPKTNAPAAGPVASGIVKARQDLADALAARSAKVTQWEDGWFQNDKKELYSNDLQAPVRDVIRTVGPDEADDAAISPEVTSNQLQYIGGQKAEQSKISKLRITLWLPSEHRDDPNSRVFIDKVATQAADANPTLRVMSPAELAELLVPASGAGKITQISMEILDDTSQIAGGYTARKIVEEEVRVCLRDGAERAKVQVEPPLIRQFLNYQKLANQIAEAKGGRIMLVAHDLQEHRAASTPDAHRMLARKVRVLKESVEGIAAPARGQIIPITIVVTNYANLKDDFLLDEEIAGIKWRLLPGELKEGKFNPDPDVYNWLVGDIAKILQQPPGGSR